jgi:hypothetical protein
MEQMSTVLQAPEGINPDAKFLTAGEVSVYKSRRMISSYHYYSEIMHALYCHSKGALPLRETAVYAWFTILTTEEVTKIIADL